MAAKNQPTTLSAAPTVEASRTPGRVRLNVESVCISAGSLIAQVSIVADHSLPDPASQPFDIEGFERVSRAKNARLTLGRMSKLRL